jgi:hypothetical protein
MRLPRFRLRELILAVAGFAAWFALFHAYPAESGFFIICSVPFFILVLLEIRLDEGRDKERNALHRAYLWVGLSGISAFALQLAIRGFHNP